MSAIIDAAYGGNPSVATIPTIHRNLNLQVHPTPVELANCFANLDSKEQAQFFNQLGIIVKNWGQPLCFQLESVSQEFELTDEGRAVMREIGEYSAKPASTPPPSWLNLLK